MNIKEEINKHKEILKVECKKIKEVLGKPSKSSFNLKGYKLVYKLWDINGNKFFITHVGILYS